MGGRKRAYLEGIANAEPDGEVEAGLRPGEDPGDGAQVVDGAGRLALGGAAADVHAAQLIHGRRRLEELDEARVPPHNAPVRRARHLCRVSTHRMIPVSMCFVH